MLEKVFTDLIGTYNDNLSDRYWNEIIINYSDAGRYYHTLDHIESMYNELCFVKADCEDWETLLFSLIYHDIVYNVQRSDNETKSADIAQLRLDDIGYPRFKTSKSILQILATKGHNNIAKDKDTDYFLDADLSILW